MKNTTLRGLFAASLILVSSNVFAQADIISSNADVSANVVVNITNTKVSDLNFGTVFQGVDKTITKWGTPDGAQLSSSPVSAAQFAITKQAETPFTLKLITDQLENDDLTLDTDYDADIVLTSGVNTQATNVPLTNASGEGIELSVTDATLLTATAISVRVGGKVMPTADQGAVVYTTTITLNASYN